MAQTIGTSNKVDVWADDGTVVEPASSKVDVGWQLGEQPPHEFMNWLQNTFGQKLNHVLQHGVPRWNSATEYGVGDFVTHNGQLYRATNVNTNSEPPSGNWQTYEVQGSATDTGPGLLARAEFQRNLREIVVIPYDVSPGSLPAGFTKDSAGQVTWDTTAFPWLKFVRAFGGASGGSGGGSLGGSDASAASGGGAGAPFDCVVYASDLLSTETLTIGAPAAAPSAGNNSGNSGNATSFGSHATCTGGLGGLGDANGSGNLAVVGGLGGATSYAGTAVQILPADSSTGQQGGPSLRQGGSVRYSGQGGSSPFGAGGHSPSGGGNSNGQRGKGWCAGGSGATSASDSRPGGAGAPGGIVLQLFG